MKTKLKLLSRIGLLLFLSLQLSQLQSQDPSEDFSKWTDKGKSFVGLSFSVMHEEGTNVQQFLSVDQEFYSLDWAIRLYGGYFLKKNMNLGAMFQWAQTIRNRTYVQDGVTINEENIHHGFLIGPTFRTYLPISKNNRALLFNDLNLLFGFGNGVKQADNNSEISRTTSDSYSLKLGLAPGINFHISKGWAFEAAIDLLGLETRLDESVTDGVESRYVSNNVNFSINLLALKLGVTKYF